MAFDIVVRDRIQASIVSKLRLIGQEAGKSSSILARMRTNMSRMGQATGMATVTGRVSTLNGHLATTNKRLTTMAQGFDRATNRARRLLSGVLLLQASDSITQSLDTFENIQNRLRGVSNVRNPLGDLDQVATQERLLELNRQLFDVAQRARVPVGELAKTYRRLDIALNQVGASQEESIRITETVSKMLTLSGATAGETASSLLQLSQAFNKGKLDGDEFRSVAELMPQAITKIAEVLGITRGEIFDFAEEGKITTEVMRKAFGELADEVDEDFGRIKRTVGQALTQLFNEITFAFGGSPNGTSFLDTLINGIDWVKNNLPTVINLFKALGTVMAVHSIGGFVANFFTLEGLLSNLTFGLSATIGYFAFFADEILVLGDGVTTLQDIFVGLYQTLTQYFFNGEGILSSLFNPETAQSFFDMVWPILKSLTNGILYIGQVGMAVWDTWFALPWDKFGLIAAEAIKVPFAAVWNLIYGAISYGVLGLIDMFDKFMDFLLMKAHELVSLVTKAIGQIGMLTPAMDTTLNQITDGIIAVQRFSLDDLFEGNKNYSSFEEFLAAGKFDISGMTTEIQNAAALGSKAWTDSMKSSTEAIGGFYDSVTTKARANADARIQEEQRYQQSIQANPGALRGSTKTFFGNQKFSPFHKARQGQSTTTETVAALKKINSVPDGFKDRKESVQDFNEGMTKTSAIAGTIATKLTTTNLALNSSEQAVAKYVNSAIVWLDVLQQKAIQTGQVIENSQVSAWDAATRAAKNYATVASSNQGGLYDFETQEGQSRIRSNIMSGFASGGYTGGGSRSSVAGVVHGQEFVMPAAQTQRYRAELESMRAGRTVGNSGITVNIQNYGNSTHEVQQISANEVRIIAREEASGAVSKQLSNPNSSVSKSMRSNLNVKRRR